MIVADTSALVAVLFDEPEADRFLDIMRDMDRILVAAPSVLELRIVVARRYGFAHVAAADLMLGARNIEIAPWSAEHLPLATEALRRFSGRPAQLNLGDCMVYALARHHDAPLLYKGGDFARTDVRSALD